MPTRDSQRSTTRSIRISTSGGSPHRSSSGLCNVMNASDPTSPKGPKDSEDREAASTLSSQFKVTEEAVKRLIAQVERLEQNEVHDKLKADLEYELEYNLEAIRTSGVLQELTEPHEIDGLRGALKDRQTAIEGISRQLGNLPKDSQKEKEKAKKEVINAIRDILTKPLEIANEIEEKLNKQKV